MANGGSRNEDMFIHAVPKASTSREPPFISPHHAWFRHNGELILESEGTWAGRRITSWRVPGQEVEAQPFISPRSAFSSLGVRHDLVPGNLIRDFNSRYRINHRAAPVQLPATRKGRAMPVKPGREVRPREHSLWNPSPPCAYRPPPRNPIFDATPEAVSRRPMSTRTTYQSAFRPYEQEAKHAAKQKISGTRGVAELQAMLEDERRLCRKAEAQLAQHRAAPRQHSSQTGHGVLVVQGGLPPRGAGVAGDR